MGSEMCIRDRVFFVFVEVIVTEAKRMSQYPVTSTKFDSAPEYGGLLE